MKTKQLLGLALVGTVVLTGCGKEETPVVEQTPVVEETPVVNETPVVEQTEGFTGVASSSVAYSEDSTDVIKTEIEFTNGTPVSVKIDVISEDGSSKVEKSANGEYVMKEGEELAWHEQIAALEQFLTDNNFDLSLVPVIDEAGHVDAVSGVSIKVESYLTAVASLLAEVQSGSYGSELAQTDELAVEVTEDVTEEATEEVTAE